MADALSRVPTRASSRRLWWVEAEADGPSGINGLKGGRWRTRCLASLHHKRANLATQRDGDGFELTGDTGGDEQGLNGADQRNFEHDPAACDAPQCHRL